MEQYIPKAAVIAEIERRMKLRKDSYDRHNTVSDFVAWEELEYFKEEFLPALEVEEVMPALDNGKMPIERWREAVKAASNQANYRKRQGFTETCDDYFVDGVQWADEHPVEAKEVDFNEEVYRYCSEHYNVYDDWNKTLQTKDKKTLLGRDDYEAIARHFIGIGLKARKE